VQTEVALSTLHLPQERPVDAGLVSQRLLTEAQPFSAQAHALAKDARRSRRWALASPAKPIRPDT
jgi:hypothetical protein